MGVQKIFVWFLFIISTTLGTNMNNITLSYSGQQYDKTKSIFNTFPTTKKLGGNLPLGISSHKKDEPQKTTSNKGATALLIAGGGLLFLSKGVQKGGKKLLNGLKDHFEGQFYKNYILNNEKKSSFYEYSVRKINSFIKKSESINNITSVKDILFMRTMYQTKPTKKIHQGITKLFEQTSRKTVKSAYKKTSRDFNTMSESFDKLDDYLIKTCGDEVVEYKGVKATKKEFIERAKNYRESVKIVVDAFISDETQEARYNYIKKSTSELYSKFWDESFKDFWSKDNKFKRKEMWQTFIASEQIKDNKTDLAENVAFARNMLSYTDTEKSHFVIGYIKNLNSIISPEDTESVEIMKRLEWFSKDKIYLNDEKETFLKEIDKLDKHQITQSKDENVAKTQLKDKNTNIRLLRNIITDSATGELQDMIDIYRKIAPFELAKSGAIDSANKAVKSFDKSVKLEVEEFFDKARDLELGSAPTDVLTILISCGMITYGLDKAKGSDEKASVMLKSGIPIVGAVATSLISATKLISGGKSLALGFVSGFVLNRMGIEADDFRKSFFKQKRTT